MPPKAAAADPAEPVQDPALPDHPSVQDPQPVPAPAPAKRPRAVPQAVAEPPIPQYDLTPPATRPQPTTGGITPAQLVPLKIGGRDVVVSQDAADAIVEREQQYARGITMDRQARQEYEQLKQWAQAIQRGPNAGTAAPQTGQPSAPDLNEIWFTNPAQAAQWIQQRTTADLEQKWRVAEAERTFWDGFYRKHPEYQDDDDLVKMLAQKNLPALMGLPTADERMTRLGELTGNAVLRISRKVKAADQPMSGRSVAQAERPTSERVEEPTPEEEEEKNLPTTLGGAILQRRRARAAAGARR